MNTTKNEPVNKNINPKILYIDDDADDCIFLKESFATWGNNHLICASNGEEAISYLNAGQKDELPSLIILDLNMPKRNGKETLSILKSTPDYANIPVVILSTSDNDLEKVDCVQMGAASYYQKPYQFSGYKEIVVNCLSFIKE